MTIFRSTIDRFNARYIPEPNSGCWLWEAAINRYGYGRMRFGGYSGCAHRFSYIHFRGPIPDGLHVCHRCDMPCCVNPDHLWLGTHRENMRDCVQKQRRDSTTSSKLTWESAREIRALAPTISKARLAEKFGVDRSLISRIINGKIWRDRQSISSIRKEREKGDHDV